VHTPRSLFRLAVLSSLAVLLFAPAAAAQSLLNQTEAAFDNSDYRTVIVLADSMVMLDTLNINNDVPTALRVEAQAHRELGDWEEAIATLDDAVERDPFFSGAYEMKARILTERGDVVRAQAAAEEAARLEPQSQNVHVLFGNIQFKTQSYSAAIDTYSKVISHNPTHVEALVKRGRSHLKLGQLEKAYFDGVDAIKQAPDNPDAHRVKAEAQFRARQYSNAANTYGTLIEKLRAVDAPPLSIATAYSNRGQARFNLGRLDEAIADLDEAIQAAPDLAVAYRTRGMAYGRKEERELACNDFNQALDLGLDDPFRSEVEEILNTYCTTP